MSRETILENQSINTDGNEKKLSKKSLRVHVLGFLSTITVPLLDFV